MMVCGVMMCGGMVCGVIVEGWCVVSVYWLHETSVASYPQVSYLASKGLV